jgi:hypothetical protein
LLDAIQKASDTGIRQILPATIVGPLDDLLAGGVEALINQP